jgi:hypothetical protein
MSQTRRAQHKAPRTQRLAPWGAAVVALVAPWACSPKITVLVTEDAGATTTHTATTTMTTATTSTSTSSTTTSTCPADLTAKVGASEACDECAGESCCSEAVALDMGVAATYTALVACAVGPGGDGDGPCAADCVSNVCSSDYAFAFLQACAECLSSSCCSEFDACSANGACDDCLWNFPEGCCDDELFQAWNACWAGPCTSACGPAACASSP